MTSFSAFQIMQLAIAILLGNVMTRVLFRGWQRIREERSDFWTTMFYVAPLAAIVIVLLGSTG